MKINMNDAFPVPKKRTHIATKRHYDVRVTLNKCGRDNTNVVRFGFINKAAKAFGSHLFIEASDVEYTKNRIYFLCHDEQIHRNVHKLSSNRKAKNDSCYFAITPSEKAEKIYRMNWIGKTYQIQFDEENDLYFIENGKEG